MKNNIKKTPKINKNLKIYKIKQKCAIFMIKYVI